MALCLVLHVIQSRQHDLEVVADEHHDQAGGSDVGARAAAV